MRISKLLFALAIVASFAAPALALSPKEVGMHDLMKAISATVDVPPKLMIRAGCPGDYKTPGFKVAERLLPNKPESFVIARVGSEIAIVGRDEVGVMYGCFELAERLDMKGRIALDIRTPIVQSPAVEFRAVNLFLTLP